MSGLIATDVSALDFGAQGGDPSRGVDMDLSTCVNRYGPAPAVIAALRPSSRPTFCFTRMTLHRS
jgi:hypothetical protein